MTPGEQLAASALMGEISRLIQEKRVQPVDRARLSHLLEIANAAFNEPPERSKPRLVVDNSQQSYIRDGLLGASA